MGPILDSSLRYFQYPDIAFSSSLPIHSLPLLLAPKKSKLKKLKQRAKLWCVDVWGLWASSGVRHVQGWHGGALSHVRLLHLANPLAHRHECVPVELFFDSVELVIKSSTPLTDFLVVPTNHNKSPKADWMKLGFVAVGLEGLVAMEFLWLCGWTCLWVCVCVLVCMI